MNNIILKLKFKRIKLQLKINKFPIKTIKSLKIKDLLIKNISKMIMVEFKEKMNCMKLSIELQRFYLKETRKL